MINCKATYKFEKSLTVDELIDILEGLPEDYILTFQYSSFNSLEVDDDKKTINFNN